MKESRGRKVKCLLVTHFLSTKAEDDEAKQLVVIAHREEYCGLDGSHRQGGKADSRQVVMVMMR